MKPSKSLCLYFQIHQPTRLRLYRFFDIGKDSHYYDDFTNRTILRRVAEQCYLPMNSLLLDLVKTHKGAFKVAFSISGSALEQFDRYAPEVIESFRRLADTGCAEFLCETYYHSLASLACPAEFRHQVLKHKAAIEQYFGVTPVTFRNTELIYSDAIGESVYDLGFSTMLTEGARHILGWRSPDFVYTDDRQENMKLLLRNYKLSDDIAFRFSNKGWSEWPLTGEKYLAWLKNDIQDKGDVINLFMDYETFGEHQSASTGIFDFMRYLPEAVIKDGTFRFDTPSEAAASHKPVSSIEVPEPISWADEERDVTAWLGNELQQEAYNKLYRLYEKVALINDPALFNDFGHLQESDHFYYMCTKFFSDGEVHKYFNPYDTPYEAFINYMNVLSDFIIRVNEEYSTTNAKFATSNAEEVSLPVAEKPEEPAKPAPKARKAASKTASAVKKTPAKKPAAKKAVKGEAKPAAKRRKTE
ncbi:MAG: glycoside hydrolase family 57 protein [Candidatus Cryptobacteroides sp.]|nr:glycoside hydrolase family 57 protein [Bacteroidales bacterium]